MSDKTETKPTESAPEQPATKAAPAETPAPAAVAAAPAEKPATTTTTDKPAAAPAAAPADKSSNKSADDALFRMTAESQKRAAAEAEAARLKTEAEAATKRAAELEARIKTLEAGMNDKTTSDKTEAATATTAPAAAPAAVEKPALTQEQYNAMRAELLAEAKKETLAAMEKQKLDAAATAVRAKYGLPEWAPLEGNTVAELEAAAKSRKTELSPAVSQELQRMGVPSPASAANVNSSTLPRVGIRSTATEAKAFAAAKSQKFAEIQAQFMNG